MEKQSTRTEKINHWLDGQEGLKSLPGEKILCAGIPQESADRLARRFPGGRVVLLTGKAGPDRAQAGETATPLLSADHPSHADSGGLPSSGPAPAAAPSAKRKQGGSAGAPSLCQPISVPRGLDSYEGGLFDAAVFLGRRSAQDLPSDPAFPAWPRGAFLLRRAQLLMEYFEDSAHALCRHLRPGGLLYCLVRAGQDEYLLGWCLALFAEGLSVDPGSIRQILCRENGSRLVLQGLVARREAPAQASGPDAIGRPDSATLIPALIAGILNFRLDRMNTAAEELQGQDAEVLLQADTASLLKGYHIYHEGSLKGKLAAYASATRPDVIYYFTDVEGDGPYLRRFHTADRDKLLRHLRGELHRQKAADKGISWKELALMDDWTEAEV